MPRRYTRQNRGSGEAPTSAHAYPARVCLPTVSLRSGVDSDSDGIDAGVASRRSGKRVALWFYCGSCDHPQQRMLPLAQLISYWPTAGERTSGKREVGKQTSRHPVPARVSPPRQPWLPCGRWLRHGRLPFPLPLNRGSTCVEHGLWVWENDSGSRITSSGDFS